MYCYVIHVIFLNVNNSVSKCTPHEGKTEVNVCHQWSVTITLVPWKRWGWNAMKIKHHTMCVCVQGSMSSTGTHKYAIYKCRFLLFSAFLVLRDLWSGISEPRCLLQTERHWASQRGSMWCSAASCHCPAMPICRMHTLHVGRWWMGRRKYRLIPSLSSYLQVSHEQMSNHPIKVFIVWELGSFFLCTVKRKTCKNPYSLTSIVWALVITSVGKITSKYRWPSWLLSCWIWRFCVTLADSLLLCSSFFNVPGFVLESEA